MGKTARVWDVASGKAIGDPMWHEEGVYSAQFSPDSSCSGYTAGNGWSA
jgi:hypothetical protein